MSQQGTPAGVTFNGAMEALEEKFENRFAAIDDKIGAVDCKIDDMKTMMALFFNDKIQANTPQDIKKDASSVEDLDFIPPETPSRVALPPRRAQDANLPPPIAPSEIRGNGYDPENRFTWKFISETSTYEEVVEELHFLKDVFTFLKEHAKASNDIKEYAEMDVKYNKLLDQISYLNKNPPSSHKDVKTSPASDVALLNQIPLADASRIPVDIKLAPDDLSSMKQLDAPHILLFSPLETPPRHSLPIKGPNDGFLPITPLQAQENSSFTPGIKEIKTDLAQNDPIPLPDHIFPEIPTKKAWPIKSLGTEDLFTPLTPLIEADNSRRLIYPADLGLIAENREEQDHMSYFDRHSSSDSFLEPPPNTFFVRTVAPIDPAKSGVCQVFDPGKQPFQIPSSTLSCSM
jgi:hypothetical protein